MRIIQDFLLCVEREPKGAKLIGDHSYRPNILLRDVWFCYTRSKNFRRHILDSPSDLAKDRGLALIIWIHILGKSKIIKIKENFPILICFN